MNHMDEDARPVAGGGSPTPPRSRVAVLAALMVTLSSSMPVYVVGALSVEMRRSLELGPGALGVAVGLYYLGAAASSIPLSRLAERVGGGRVMRVSSAVEAILLLMIAAFATTSVVLAVLLAATGVVSGAIMPATYLFLARRVEPRRQGLAFGVNQAAVPLAPLLGGLAVPFVALTVGWRWAFVMAAGLAIGASVIVPASLSSLSERRQARQAAAPARMRVLPLVVLSAGLGLGMFAASGILAFLAPGAVSGGFSRADAGFLVAAVGAVTVFGRIVVGFRADRRDGEHLRIVATMAGIGAVGYLLMAAGAQLHTRWLFVVAALLATGVGWAWNALFNLSVVRSHLQAPAKATGITDVGGRLGGVAGPVVAGQIVAHGSFQLAWAVMAVAGFAAGAAVLAGRHLLKDFSVVRQGNV